MTKNEILHLIENYGSVDKAAPHSGMSVRAFRRAAKEAQLNQWPDITHSEVERAMTNAGMNMDGSPIPEIETSRTKEGEVITLKSNTVRTEAQAIAAAQVDLKIWEVERCVINKWDVGAKNAEKNMTALELWQVKLFLKRRLPQYVTDAIDSTFKNFVYKPIKFETLPILDRHLLEVSLYDAHFGKLCWGRETGRDYDLRTASRYFQYAVDKLLRRSAGYPIDRILFPVGNDFFHIDNWMNTTAKGTHLDVDTRLGKIFEVGCEALVHAIDRCLQVAPVDVIWIPGNHDPATSWYLAKYLEAWYRTVPEVRVNKDPMHRKYIQYGCVMNGYTHGNMEKHDSLPTLMAVEQPQMWAATTCRGWRLGHFHTKRQKKYTSGDTINGVTIDVLPSLSGTDAWHFESGYVGNPQAAQATLWSHDEGWVADFGAKV